MPERMDMSEHLAQSDFEDLSAWMDGELPADRAAEVSRLVREDAVWQRAECDLRALHEALDGCDPPAAKPGLASRILAGIPKRELTDSEIEELSAYMDGELPAQDAQRVVHNVATQPEWRQTLRDFKEVGQVLDTIEVPAAPEGLAGRVVSAVRRRQHRRHALRVGSWLAPAAAAAMVLIGLAIFNGTPNGHRSNNPANPTVSQELAKSAAFQAVPVKERPALQEEIVRHLDFFQDYDVLTDYDTLKAIDKLDSQAQGT